MMMLVANCAMLQKVKISTPKCSEFVEDLLRKSEQGVLVETLETMPSDAFYYLDLLQCIELNLIQ